MIQVIGVSFFEKGPIYYFFNENLQITKGMNVIVETEIGLQYAFVKTDIVEIDQAKLNSPLRSIIRIADNQDYQKYQKNLIDAKKALEEARKIAKNLEMKIQLIDAMYTFDRDKLLFRFLSDSRIDFRNLARELAAKYRTRIELRQIGARDKAKEIGGCGQCGRALCCSSFLKNMDSVSISMAKNQNVSLNPNKINGLCGRLLCCLAYEDENYKLCKKDLPTLGQIVETKEGKGQVISLDILKNKYKVEIQGIGVIEVDGCNGCN